MSDYKVETKPTLWHITLDQGAYSDRDEMHYFIRANDRDEAWHLFKAYWTDLVDVRGEHGYTRGNLLVYVDQDDHEVERFKPQKWGGIWEGDDEEPDYDHYSGNAWKVQLRQLSVVEFRR